MKIMISCRKNTDLDMLIEKLYRMTPLQSSHSTNMNVLVDSLPKVLSVQQVIERWVSWRTSVIKRQLTFDIKNMKDKLHLLRGLEKILLDIDKTISIILHL